MQLLLTESRLLPGTRLEGNVLVLPRIGGGILLPEVKGTGRRWLNLHMTVLSDHAQAFELRAYGGEETPRVTVRFGLMPNFRAAVALDLNWLDGHILFPGHRVGTQKVVCHGSRIAREEIRQAELVSMPGAAPVSVRVEDVELADAPCMAELPCREMLIDEFGQYIPKEWPGKVRREEELVNELKREAALPDQYPGADYTVWGGCAGRKLQEGTGYFGKAKRNGRWYLTDPSGCAFFSMGPDCAALRPR